MGLVLPNIIAKGGAGPAGIDLVLDLAPVTITLVAPTIALVGAEAGCAAGTLTGRPFVSATLAGRSYVTGTLRFCGVLVGGSVTAIIWKPGADNVLDLEDLQNDLDPLVPIDLAAATVTIVGVDAETGNTVIASSPMALIVGSTSSYRYLAAETLPIVDGQRIDVTVTASEGGVFGVFVGRILVQKLAA